MFPDSPKTQVTIKATKIKLDIEPYKLHSTSRVQNLSKKLRELQFEPSLKSTRNLLKSNSQTFVLSKRSLSKRVTNQIDKKELSIFSQSKNNALSRTGKTGITSNQSFFCSLGDNKLKLTNLYQKPSEKVDYTTDSKSHQFLKFKNEMLLKSANSSNEISVLKNKNKKIANEHLKGKLQKLQVQLENVASEGNHLLFNDLCNSRAIAEVELKKVIALFNSILSLVGDYLNTLYDEIIRNIQETTMNKSVINSFDIIQKRTINRIKEEQQQKFQNSQIYKDKKELEQKLERKEAEFKRQQNEFRFQIKRVNDEAKDLTTVLSMNKDYYLKYLNSLQLIEQKDQNLKNLSEQYDNVDFKYRTTIDNLKDSLNTAYGQLQRHSEKKEFLETQNLTFATQCEFSKMENKVLKDKVNQYAQILLMKDEEIDTLNYLLVKEVKNSQKLQHDLKELSGKLGDLVKSKGMFN